MNLQLKIELNIVLLYLFIVNSFFGQFSLIKVPSPPLNLRLNQLRQETKNGVTSLLADISWDPPENSNGVIMGYRVRHRLVGPQNLIDSLISRKIPIKEILQNVTGTYYSLFSDGLGFGKVYEFSVAGINTEDIGLEGKLNISTIESAPDSFPISIDITGLTSQSVNISWQPPNPENHNGIIINYQVLYFLYGLKNTTTRTTNTPNLFACIEGLEENMFYTFQVRAYTKGGPGPWCSNINFRTVVFLPDPPVNIEAKRINEHQIKVTWELSPNNNIKVVGFKIYYCLQSVPKDIESCNTLDVGPVTMVTLGNIEYNSDYQVAIRSKAIDNRYGALSNICVSKMSNVPKITDLSVKGLKCDGKVRLIEIRWTRPEIDKDLFQFLIRINGYSSFINQTGLTHKVFRQFKMRKLGYIKQFIKFVIDLKDMEPNMVYDISVQTLYKDISDKYQEGKIQNTSCRTMMTRPKFVLPPDIVFINRTTFSVLFRIYRVTEKLGVIRRYYLFLEESSKIGDSSMSKYSLDLLKSSIKPKMDNPTLIAEFTTEIFKKSSNITLLVGEETRFSHSNKFLYSSDFLLMSPILLSKEKHYRIFLRACIYQEHTTLSDNDLSSCTDSPWRSVFNFQKFFSEPLDVYRPKPPNRKHDVFTVSIIAIIVGLGIVALGSIAVGCFMKRKANDWRFHFPGQRRKEQGSLILEERDLISRHNIKASFNNTQIENIQNNPTKQYINSDS